MKKLAKDMLDTMYAAPGIGLAAPQVGELKRIVVMDLAKDGETPEPIVMINPEILKFSDETVTTEEGCLAIPDLYYEVERPAEVTVTKVSTIHWVNKTATTHTITPDNSGQAGVWAAQNISGSGTDFSHTFSTTGAFTYRCTIPAGMTGTIKVQ